MSTRCHNELPPGAGGVHPGSETTSLHDSVRNIDAAIVNLMVLRNRLCSSWHGEAITGHPRDDRGQLHELAAKGRIETSIVDKVLDILDGIQQNGREQG
jgi:hypothetical protein